MSDTETEQLHQQARSLGRAGAGPDFDAEHRPDVAGRSSRADLKRAASADGAPLTEGEQRAKSQGASLDGLRAAATLATQEVYQLTSQINQLNGSALNEGGWDLRMQLVQSCVSSAQSTVERLTHEIQNAQNVKVPVGQLQETMRGFSAAYRVFSFAIAGARKKAIDAHQTFTADEAQLDHAVARLYEPWGGEPKTLLGLPDNHKADHPTPGDKVDDPITSSLRANLTALTESVNVVKVTLKSKDTKTRDNDLGLMLGHLLEVGHIVEQADRAKLAKYRAQIKAAISLVRWVYHQADEHSLKDVHNRLETAAVPSQIFAILEKVSP